MQGIWSEMKRAGGEKRGTFSLSLSLSLSFSFSARGEMRVREGEGKRGGFIGGCGRGRER